MTRPVNDALSGGFCDGPTQFANVSGDFYLYDMKPNFPVSRMLLAV